MKIYTAGYSGRSPQGLIEAFKKASIGLVIDVRLSPFSRLPQWNREELAHALEIGGMRYQHARGLGNPWYPKGRSVSIQQGREILAKFRAHLGSDPGAKNSLQWLVSLLQQPPASGVVLLCACPASSRCHRSVIVEELLQQVPELVEVAL